MHQKSWHKGWLGVELDPVNWQEKALSGIGGLISIIAVTMICHNALHLAGTAMLTASMGATAVLLFAVPHGPLSQPWPVVAGHGFAALIGVTCAKFIPNLPLAAGLAVGLTIVVMHVGKCLHPPGGGTALSAVIGGAGVTSLGYGFVLFPVLLNAVVLIALAVAFNWFLPWRRYPAALNRKAAKTPADDDVTHEEVVEALKSVNSFVDITEDDLIRLHHLLSKRTKKIGKKPTRRAATV